MSNLIEKFKSDLVGTYSNQAQAFSNPCSWANIYIKFSDAFPYVIYTKSWYAIDDEDNPYKNSIINLSTTNNYVIMSTKIGNDNLQFCEITFEHKCNFWVGENLKCVIPNKGSYISTSIKFDGINYYSRDAGYDLNTNKKLWGKDLEEGMFHFIKRE